MGMPQFVSSSYRNFAVDFNQKGKRDLLHDTQDVIGSVANYFKQSGWKTQEPVIYPVASTGPKNEIATLETNRRNPELKYTLGALNKQGIQLFKSARLTPETPVAVIALEEAQGIKYWLGLNNFYVITRYNRSNHYAMAVYELSQKIKALKEQG
jgi:membrane-bound lytic murein transglycosylase B